MRFQQQIQGIIYVMAYNPGSADGFDCRTLRLDNADTQCGFFQQQTIIDAVTDCDHLPQVQMAGKIEFRLVLRTFPYYFQTAGYVFQLRRGGFVGVGRDDMNVYAGTQLPESSGNTGNQFAVHGNGAVEIEYQVFDCDISMRRYLEKQHVELFPADGHNSEYSSDSG
jgi:hypothetical protein